MQSYSADTDVTDSSFESCPADNSYNPWEIDRDASCSPAILQHGSVGCPHTPSGVIQVHWLVDHEISPCKKGKCFGTLIHHSNNSRVAVRRRLARCPHHSIWVVHTVPVDDDGIKPAVSNCIKCRIKLATNLSLNGEIIQDLIHDTENLGVAGEEKSVESNLFVDHDF